MKNNTILKLHTYICRVEFLMYFCMNVLLYEEEREVGRLHT